MSARGALVEAVALPWLLLTAALIGGMRVTEAGEMRFLPPPLAAMVAMLLLVAVLVQGGVVRPWLLMHERRTALENLSGAVVIITLASASAQIVAAVTPEAGLPRVLGVVFLIALLANTLAAGASRPATLRALFVAFFAAFSVKYIVLDALYAPDRSFGGRLLTGLLEGVTLGSMDHVVWGGATGYLTFMALVLYFAALVLMPRGAPAGGASPALRTDRDS